MPFSKTKVANSTATGRLSKTEEKTAQKYRKMKKMGLPEGAILHKMIADGVPAHIRDNVMAGEEAPNTSQGASAMGRSNEGGSQSSLSSQEEKIAAQYRKLLRIKMPRVAVSHKMIADGVSQKIQDSVMNGDVPQASTAPSQSRGGGRVSSLSTADEKVAAPYRKMIRMKMPQGAVRHKMTADGVSQHIQDSVLNGEVPSTSSSSSQSSSRGGATGPVSSLSKQDEKVAAPYRKMMRMKMPEGAVRHKMTADGVPQHIQDSVLAREVPNDGSDGGDNAPAPPMRRPVNPMAAAVSSSGGIGSLKKTEKKSEGVRPPSNPTAALIAGGMGSLKKAPVNEKKPEASNPLLAAINASGGRGGLKKTPPKANNSSTHTTSSGNSLLDELSAKGFGSTLRRTPPKKVSRPRPKSNIFMSVGDEFSSDDVISRSTQSRTTQMSSYQSSDMSSSESSDDDAYGIEVSLPAEEPKVPSPVSRRYAGMKVKGVRATGTARPEGSFERNSNTAFPKERPGRYSKAKTVTPAGMVQVNELSVRKSCGTNNDYRPPRAYASKAKPVRQWPPQPQAEEPSEKSNNPLKNYSPKRSPGRKNRFAKQPEEQRQSNGSFESTGPRQEKRQSEASIISMIHKPRSTSSTTHTSTTIGTLDAANLEKDFAKAVQANIRSKTAKTFDMSGRSASRSKHRGSEWNNDRLARRNRRTFTTADGVDHHCNCTIM